MGHHLFPANTTPAAHVKFTTDTAVQDTNK